MFSPSQTQSAYSSNVLQYAIQHDIEDIDDLDEFLHVDEAEEEVIAMLYSAGSLY